MALARLMLITCCIWAAVQGCEVWDFFSDTQSTSGSTSETAGENSVADCMNACNSSSTCVMIDYDKTAGLTTARCHSFTSIQKIGTRVTTYQLRPLTNPCPTPVFYELYYCQINRYLGFKGLTDLAYSITTKTSLSDCRDLCFNDGSTTCGGYTYLTASSSNCELYDLQYSTVISPGTDGTMYVFGTCPTRNPAEQGFHLRHSYRKSNTGATATGVNTFTGCWGRCWYDYACNGFDFSYTLTTAQCIINDETAINDTSYSTSYYHHVLLSSASFDTSNTAVTAPSSTTLLADPDETTCKKFNELLNKRSYSATLNPTGTANMQTCVELCRADSGCAAIDYENKVRPFKGVRCYTFSSTPSSHLAVTDRHQIQKLNVNCPTTSTSVSNSGCTWESFPSYKGVHLSGITNTATTTLATCMTACAATYDCWAVDFSTSNVCTFYQKVAAYWFVDSSTTTHYVRTMCSS